MQGDYHQGVYPVMLSVIVPFRNAARFLPETVEPFIPILKTGRVELLLVDNQSTDESRQVIEKSLAGNSGYKILTCNRLGAGPARNLGLELARGKFIAFLDADDVIQPHSLLDLCQRMDEEEAMLAIFNHVRLHGDGSFGQNSHSHLLERSAPVVHCNEKIELLTNTNYVWNKIYRRSLIDDFGLSFSEGIYQDAPWSISCLFAAEKIITQPKVLYTYRQHPDSTIWQKGEQHLVFATQYKRALDFCLSHNCSEQWKDALVVRAVKHGLGIAYIRKRMNLRLRNRFFSDLVSLIDKYAGANVIQQSNQFSKLQKLAFRRRSGYLLEMESSKTFSWSARQMRRVRALSKI